MSSATPEPALQLQRLSPDTDLGPVPLKTRWPTSPSAVAGDSLAGAPPMGTGAELADSRHTARIRAHLLALRTQIRVKSQLPPPRTAHAHQLSSPSGIRPPHCRRAVFRRGAITAHAVEGCVEIVARGTCQATNEGLLDRGKTRSLRICIHKQFSLLFIDSSGAFSYWTAAFSSCAAASAVCCAVIKANAC